ncbi:MAG: hypothetical protein ACI9FB_004524, partial [Candidatus Azotimanducaceae bacterium]
MTFAVESSPTPIQMTKVDASEVDILIDGILDESIWSNLPMKDDMAVVEPDTLAPPPWETKSYLFYTEKGLYLGVWAEQPPETLVSRLSSRDGFISRDGVSITL